MCPQKTTKLTFPNEFNINFHRALQAENLEEVKRLWSITAPELRMEIAFNCKPNYFSAVCNTGNSEIIKWFWNELNTDLANTFWASVKADKLAVANTMLRFKRTHIPEEIWNATLLKFDSLRSYMLSLYSDIGIPEGFRFGSCEFSPFWTICLHPRIKEREKLDLAAWMLDTIIKNNLGPLLFVGGDNGDAFARLRAAVRETAPSVDGLLDQIEKKPKAGLASHGITKLEEHQKAQGRPTVPLPTPPALLLYSKSQQSGAERSYNANQLNADNTPQGEAPPHSTPSSVSVGMANRPHK